MPKGKHYNKEFRLGAARLVTEQGYTQRRAAERLGISAWTIGRWIRDLRASGDLPPEDEPEADELRLLRKELADLRMENEILKKAAAYFAKESL